MNRTLRIAGIILLALSFVGCVASSKYQKLQGEATALQTEQDKLKAQATHLTEENAKLKADVDKLQSEASALAAEREALQKQQAETVNKYDDVVNQLSQEVNAGQLQITQFKNMLSVDVAEQLFFASGSATIKDTGKDVLRKVGEALATVPDKIIRVVGHTDNVPLGGQNRRFPTNWELSVMRATNVVRFLQEQCKIEPERLIASGRGPYEPVAPNDSPEGRQKNRRIEIMLIDKSVMEGMAGAPK